MPRTAVLSVFSSQAIAKNASPISNEIDLRKFGPNSKFFGDFTASGAGRVTFSQLVGNTVDDTFYTPTPASLCLASFLGGDGNASRDRYELSLMVSPYVKFKANEQNASRTVVTMDLIISMD